PTGTDVVAEAPSTQQGFPVDEEPADVESAASAPRPPQDGIVDRDEPPLPGDDEAPDEDEPPYDPHEHVSAPTAPPAAIPARAPMPERVEERPAPMRPQGGGGIERYGEAVVRQVLGARFVREEPYEPPARFS